MSESRIDMTEYENMTDHELVLSAQSGDEAALEAVLVRYRPLVYKKSQPYYLACGDDDDIFQEGLIGLYKAVMSFDKSKFPLFRVFAGACIERRILSAVKKASRLKHNPLNSYISLNDSDKWGELECAASAADMPCSSDPESILIEKEVASGLAGRINSVLSTFEMQVLLSHINGHTYKETAAAVGRDVKAVDNAMQRIKKKLENVIG